MIDRLAHDGPAAPAYTGRRAVGLQTLQYVFGYLNNIVDEKAPHFTEVFKSLFGNLGGGLHAEGVGGHHNLGLGNPIDCERCCLA